MRQRTGELWIGLGIFHLVLIGVLGHKELAGIVTAGVVDGLSGSTQREVAFWLFYLGIPFILIGLITRWAQQRLGTVPASLGWASAVSGLLGWLVVPVSGFPLMAALGLYTVRVARGEAAALPGIQPARTESGARQGEPHGRKAGNGNAVHR